MQAFMPKFDRCIFVNFGTTCDKRQMFGCFCTKHMRLFFGMDCVEDTVVTKRFTKTLYKQVFTLPSNNMVFPFPYKIEKDGTICFMRKEAYELVNQYVSQLPLQDDGNGTVRKKISATLLSLMMGGFLATDNIGTFTGLFQDYVKMSEIYYATKYTNAVIDLYYGPDDMTYQAAFSDFPILYKILFQYVEFSTIKRISGNNVEHQQDTRTFQPNLVLDLNQHAFMVVNDDNGETVAYKTDKATYGSPVIISGMRKSSSLLPFTSAQFSFSQPIDLLPNLCNTTKSKINMSVRK